MLIAGPGRRRRQASLRLALLVALFVASCVAPTAPSSGVSVTPTRVVSAQSGTFVPGPCAFVLPDGVEQGEDLTCGYLTVPERRIGATADGADSIRLAVAVFHAGTGGGTEPPERGWPVIYLSGGPGASVLETLRYEMPQVFEAVLAAGHDLVLFDQRGVGRSRPALDCPEADDIATELVDRQVAGKTVTKAEALELMVEAFGACGRRLGDSVDLSAYNSGTVCHSGKGAPDSGVRIVMPISIS